MTTPTLDPVPEPPLEVVALKNAQRGLKLVSASLPHLAGLAHSVRLQVSRRFPVAAISSTGLLLVHPRVFATAPIGDLVFVLAHELLHLALDTFGRRGLSDPRNVNIAHDYIINDILSTELGRSVPLNGLALEGARHKSLESLLAELAQESTRSPSCWSTGSRSRSRSGSRNRPQAGKSRVQEELERLGLLPPDSTGAAEEDEPEVDPEIDLIDEALEAELEPNLSITERHKLRETVQREAAKAVSLQELRRLSAASLPTSGGSELSDPGEAFLEAIQTAYTPPWQLALQHWLDAVTPGPRSYSRPSRRSASSAEVIRPGRTREGWTLHIVLDTSGSMTETLPHILGLLASFCESCGVGQIHILQCDVSVTSDQWLEPSELIHYAVTGFGGSDMSPAMLQLAEDPEVAAVLVLTDGYIEIPEIEPPYVVLWGLVDGTSDFQPPYGTVVHVRT